MLKTTGRIILILSLAALISGALFLAVNASSQSSTSPFRQKEFREHLAAKRSAGSAFEGGDFQDGHSDGDLHGIEPTMTFLGILWNLGVIALLTLVVVLLQKIWRRIFRKNKFTPPG